jgi:twitching motility protein PilT
MAEYDTELTRLVEQVNRSAKEPKGDESTPLDQFLAAAVHRQASDLLLVAGSPAILRVNGALTADPAPSHTIVGTQQEQF